MGLNSTAEPQHILHDRSFQVQRLQQIDEEQSLADGSTSLADIKKNGMSYNWEIRGKKVSGYCNVNGKGKITKFKQGI